MDIVWKGLIGGLVTALIAWLARRGNVLPGIAPLFPTLTLMALVLVGVKGDPKGFQQTVGAALKTVPAYVIFLLVCYLGAQRWNFKASLAVGLGAWFLVVLAIFLLPRVW